MQRSQRTTARFTRLCQIGAVLLFVPILMAIGCPLTVTVTCPTDGAAGTAATVTVTVSGGQGDATWTTDATNGTVADGAMASPSVTPAAGGTVTVTVTATDEAGDTAEGTCSFEATAAACTDDAGCDDGLFCNGAETCDLTDPDNGVCTAGTAQCTGTDESCDEANGACITACTDDADCDDSDACTTDTCGADGTCSNAAVDCDDADACTTDTCDAATGCVNTDVACDAGETCVGGVCVTTCVSAADCDDSDPCTDDACVANACENTAKDCDDGLFCTGTETCDAATGDCDSDGDPCAAGQTCNETDDVCDDTVACTDNAGCDDGVFCNGDETCDLTDPDAGICAVGTDPCAADQTCNETTDVCDAPDGVLLRLTTGNDTVVGTSGNDTIDGSRELVSGVAFMTLDNGDSINGGLGIDTLNAQFLGGATVAPSSLLGIEILDLEIQAGGAATLNAITGDSITTINNKSSAAMLSVTNVATIPTTLSLSNTANDFLVSVTAAALTGGTDETTLTVSGVVANGGNPNVTLQPSAAGSGFEIINLVSSGAIANSLDDLLDGNGNSFATLNISGSQDMQIITALNNTVTTVNASGATGKIQVIMGTNTATFTGGSGDDTIDLSSAAGDFTTADTIAGGDGTDTLRVDDADVIGTSANQANVTGIETIHADTQLGGNLNLTHFGAVNATVAGNTAAQTVTMADGGIFKLTAVTVDDFTITAFPNTNADTLNLELEADFDLGGTDALLAPTFEFLNVEAKTAARTLGGALTLNDAGGVSEAVTITGTNNLILNGVVTADRVDASALGGSATLVMNSPMAGLASITGGPNGDTLYNSTGNDVIDGGSGNDIIKISGGNDSITGGSGNDNFVIIDLTDDTANDAGQNVITDFEFGAISDTVQFDTEGLTLAADANPVTLALYFEGAATGMTAGTAYDVTVITDQGYANFGDAEVAVSGTSTSLTDGLVIFFNTTTSRAELYIDISLGADNDIAAGDLIVTFDNVTTLGAMTSFANTDFIFGGGQE